MFVDNVRSHIVGIGNAVKNDFDLINDALLVERLKHNLLSISKFCNKAYNVIFESSQCILEDSTFDGVILSTTRHLNTYVVFLG